MAHKVVLAEEVRRVVNGFTSDLRRAWDFRLNLLIDNPLPRQGSGFAIRYVENEFGDKFLAFVVDEFPFATYFDVYPWPQSQDNPLDFEGIVNIFHLASHNS